MERISISPRLKSFRIPSPETTKKACFGWLGGTRFEALQHRGPEVGSQFRANSAADRLQVSLSNCSIRSWSCSFMFDSLSLQFFSQKAESSEDAHLNGSRGNAQRLGDFFVWLLFDQRQRGRDLQLRRKPAERARRFPTKLLGDAGLWQRRRRQIVGEVSFRPRGLQVIERNVGGDASRPRREAGLGVKVKLRWERSRIYQD